jgi:hypothetical protein
MTMDFSRETMEAGRQWYIFQIIKKDTIYPEYYIHQKYISRMKEKSTHSQINQN